MMVDILPLDIYRCFAFDDGLEFARFWSTKEQSVK